MKIIQMTDIHFTAPGVTLGGRDPIWNFDAAMADALSRHPDTDLIAITGDLSETGAVEDYERLAERLRRLRQPVILLIGNHDDRAAFLKVFPQRQDENGFVQGWQDMPKGRALYLDTHEPGVPQGRLCETRAAWLEARLEEHAGPVYLFLHHNPIPTHIAPLDRIMLEDHAVFAGIVARHAEKIAYIFHGHLHLPMSGAIHGVPVYCPRGTNHSGYPNFGEKQLHGLSGLPQAYAVITTEGSYVSVMMVEFGYREAEKRPAASPPMRPSEAQSG